MDGSGASPPQVSVLMPVRDGEAFLARAVNSILTQTLPELELVIVDDGSDDRSAVIADAYAAGDPRVRVVRNESQDGISASLNRAAALSRAPLLARLDADDIALPDRLERQARWLASRPDVAVLGGAFTYIDARERKLRSAFMSFDPSVAIRQGPAMAHPTIMMRRAAFLAAGGYRRAFDGAEDYDLWLRIGERALLANLAEVVTYYRSHDRQATKQSGARGQALVALARELAILRRSGIGDPIGPEDRLDQDLIDRLAISPEDKARLAALVSSAIPGDTA